ncbi:FBP C-terminal treble-clef zinc-finger [Micromonospora haikouensis]|uniref:FBP C-terminal treble-clef zinc-finger n=2 Tax=Micromonosporaceae TaxID=28056 RepID=A0A1C4WBL7_9ACTN|nr:FBP domain-containing protein [Micromonospora haikouensis]SCE93627.1 FBP C-terminal treble-clef zinc-finger [Micromonospora haikouensis]
MCSICLTTPAGGVSLMVARRAGKPGQQGNTVGTYICSDLACSLYVRGRKDAGPGARLQESITLEEKIQRTVAHLAAFVAKVTA